MKQTGLLRVKCGKFLWALFPAVLVTVWISGTGLAAPGLFVSPLPTPGWSEEHTTPTPRPQPTVASTTGPATLTTGLKGCWKLDETTTGNRADGSPVGANTLSNINGVSWQNGKVGKASDFERDSGQYLKIESYQAAGLNLSRSFTLVGWVKRESINNNMAFVSKYHYESGVNKIAYRFGLSGDNRLSLVVSPNGTYTNTWQITGGATLTSTVVWYHTAAVFDADAKRLKLYVNGSLDADKAVTYNTVYQTDAPFMLGAVLGSSPTYFFDGLLDEWRVYNRVLSQSEIQALMNLQ